jgi:hypothetical protein
MYNNKDFTYHPQIDTHGHRRHRSVVAMKHQQWVGHDRPPLAKVAALPTDKQGTGQVKIKGTVEVKKKERYKEQKRKSEEKKLRGK